MLLFLSLLLLLLQLVHGKNIPEPFVVSSPCLPPTNPLFLVEALLCPLGNSASNRQLYDAIMPGILCVQVHQPAIQKKDGGRFIFYYNVLCMFRECKSFRIPCEV